MANELTELYEKEYSRVERLIKRLKKQGAISKDYPLPLKPKRVEQASINKLRQIDRTTLLGEQRRSETKLSKVQLEEEYNKQLRRINNAIKREEKKGYDMSWLKIPPKPKRITKQYVAKLEKITSRYIEGNALIISDSKEIEIQQKPKTQSTNDYSKTTASSVQKIQELDDSEKSESSNEDFNKASSKTIEDAKEEIKKEIENFEENEQEAADNAKEALKEVKDSIKPKELSDEQIEDITDAFYEESDKEQGVGNPPSEPVEVIMNVIDELGGVDEEEAKEYSSRLYNDVNGNGEENGIDSFWYDEGEMNSVLDDVLRRLENWQPSPQWSSNLQSIKRRDVSSALKMINSAIEKQGILQTARNLWEHSSELDDLISEIMYRGSGSDFLQGRDAVSTDLIRLQNILLGHTMSFEEAADLADQMESEEFYDDVTE